MVVKIENLNVDFDSDNPSDFVEVLDKIALSSKGVVDNVGTMADISKITCCSELVAVSYEEIITTTTKGYERSGPTLQRTNDAIEPLDLSLEILTNGDMINEDLLENVDTEDGTTVPDEWNEVGVHKHNIILGGTLQNHACDKKENCKTCHGSGQCQECNGHGKFRCGNCNGNGKIRCNNCGGTGTCRRCGGSGQIRCTQCGGKGSYYDKAAMTYKDCLQCNRTGYMPCPDCNGLFGTLGRCYQCDGTGEVRCKRCKGSGYLTCTHCEGTGHCTECDGTGKVVCSRCNGTGIFQTFFVCTSFLHHLSNTYISSDFLKNYNPLVGEDSIKELLGIAEGIIVFDDVYFKMSAINQIGIDRQKELRAAIEQSFKYNDNVYPSFVKHLESVRKKIENIGVPYKSSISIREIPIVKVDYNINESDYSFVIIGKDSFVLANNVPQSITVYKDGFINRIQKYFTRKKRIKSYIKLAAYIFQCDKRNIDEAKVIQEFVKRLKLKKSKEKQFISSLSVYDRSMPYTIFRSEIKSLFVSKKTLTFAWQCMSVDKTFSEEESDLFDSLCKDCGVTDILVIEKLKRFAHKFAKLNGDALVDNYIQ